MALLLAHAGPVSAGYGVFAHGYGLKSEGAGGVAVARAEDTPAMAANSAAVLSLGRRFDLGLDWLYVEAGSAIGGNAFGANDAYRSDGQAHFFIPQGGWSTPLGDRAAIGVTVFGAGFGTDYKRSPYARFGGSDRAGIKLMQSVVSTSMAYAVVPGQNVGVGLNLAYQEINAKGLGFLAPVSQSPAQVSDQGSDSEFGYSLQIGWQGRLSEQLDSGIAWRSPTRLGKFRRYRGLLPNGGQLDLPAILGLGLRYQATPVLSFSVDFSRVEFSGQDATGNPASRLAQGRLLGSDGGPGFGWRDQDIYKFGFAWDVRPGLRLRAGYSRSSEIMPPSETFFGMAAPLVMKEHYTLGTTQSLAGGWEITGVSAFVPRSRVAGSGSIPAAFGGGEADIHVQQIITGLSLGKRF
ncbi:long-chain fatty acid transporter [Solimonas sp. K1W22B-7]|uniref:OmpP1/FadL family transporter n=1 Tax=Solimonas sp. K1W22B-7 TaxID=2303331 RepID=UPI000E330FAF|nr:outer membrane protein transport protein [Solimonas sp. K1W22B-7]AXQ31080.1 long-chain fatty acid transporter [Solimonas sp. K1W22B-7]